MPTRTTNNSPQARPQLPTSANQPCGTTVGCKPADETAPPVPQVRLAIATSGLLPPDTRFEPRRGGNRPGGARDPAYIEIRNWEPGTTFELLNISDNPKASFDNSADLIKLAPTGRDIQGRTAALYIKEKQMKALKLTAGHHMMLRAVDSDGNASAPVRLRLEGSTYGTAGRAVENSNWVAASSGLRLLDGENTYKGFILKHMPDRVAPNTKYFSAEAAFKVDSKGQFTLSADGCLEPGASVTITNGRTGKRAAAGVAADQSWKAKLGKDIKDGDVLMVVVSDPAGNEAPPVELRYGAKCKNGRASSLGIIAARLPGVLG